MNPSQLNCPKCGRPDQVQKVTSVYGDNTKEWRERHGRHTSFHQARTLLGEKLAPPTKPSYPLNPVFLYGLFAFILFIGLSTTCPFIITIPLFFIPILIPAAIALPAFIAGLFYATDTSVPDWAPTAGLIVGGLLILITVAIVVAVIVAIVWVIRKVIGRYKADQASYKAKKDEIDANDLVRWQRAMDRWTNAYYCVRDESVFIPGENKAIPAENLKDYLFDPYFHST